MRNAIEHLGKEKVRQLVEKCKRDQKIPDYLGIEIVCDACVNNPSLAPDKIRRDPAISDEEVVFKWCDMFFEDYKRRASVKCGKPPRTLIDPALNVVIRSAYPSVSASDVTRIEYAHRLSMSAENLIGPLLEEYIFVNLKNHDWAMAWGKTIKSVDFCNRAGALLQIKNRSNTENSSSKQVRDGTQIKKWFRIDAAKNNFHWKELCELTAVPPNTLSEEGFQQFLGETLNSNPGILGIDPENPWVPRQLSIHGL